MTQREYPDKPSEVYFFGTCLVDLFYPEAGLAGMQLIHREGVRVVFPPDQSCCGQPAYNSGYLDEARRVARAQIELFAEPWPVVVPSASCAATMRFHYPDLFAGEPLHAQAIALSERVYELTEFLLHVLRIELQDRGEPLRVANHTSCTGRRKLGVAGAAEQLLSQLDRVEYVEQERADECCGFGGTFAVKYPEISAAMVSDKADAIEQSGADLLIGGDCGCLMNIGGHLCKRGSQLSAQHIAQFLWERTRDE